MYCSHWRSSLQDRYLPFVNINKWLRTDIIRQEALEGRSERYRKRLGAISPSIRLTVHSCSRYKFEETTLGQLILMYFVKSAFIFNFGNCD